MLAPKSWKLPHVVCIRGCLTGTQSTCRAICRHLCNSSHLVPSEASLSWQQQVSAEGPAKGLG